MDHTPPLHVLALSGGGYRGLYTATVLAELEQVLGRPIAQHFDLICGTSAGGMLALGLANEIPASELKDLLKSTARASSALAAWQGGCLASGLSPSTTLTGCGKFWQNASARPRLATSSTPC